MTNMLAFTYVYVSQTATLQRAKSDQHVLTAVIAIPHLVLFGYAFGFSNSDSIAYSKSLHR